jgi:hypothetical protein
MLVGHLLRDSEVLNRNKDRVVAVRGPFRRLYHGRGGLFYQQTASRRGEGSLAELQQRLSDLRLRVYDERSVPRGLIVRLEFNGWVNRCHAAGLTASIVAETRTSATSSSGVIRMNA